MTKQEFAEIIDRMKDGSLVKRVAEVYLNAEGLLADKYVAKKTGMKPQQVTEARTAMRKTYKMEFERKGHLNKYQHGVKLSDYSYKPVRTLNVSGMAILHRSYPWRYALGLAKLPQPV